MNNKFEYILNYITSELSIQEKEKCLLAKKPYDAITVYFMYLYRKNHNITLENIYEEGYCKSWSEAQYIPLDDVVDYLKQNVSIWNKMLEVVNQYDIEQLKELVLTLSDDNKKSDSIIELVIKKLEVGSKSRILQINNFSEKFLTELRDKNSHIYVYESHYMAASVRTMRLDVQGFSDIYVYSMRDDFDDIENFDKIFINTLVQCNRNDFEYMIASHLPDFPYGVTYCWDSCGFALSILKEEGTAFAIVDAKELTTNKAKIVREYLSKNGYIEGVIKLPEKMENDIRASLYFVILSHRNTSVKFYDASSMYEMDRVNGKKINIFSDKIINEIINNYENNAKSETLNIISENDYNLNPSRYLVDINDNTIELGQILKTTNRGFSLSATQVDGVVTSEISDIRCIVTQSIINGIVQGKLYYHGENKSFKKNYAELGDILITKTGVPFKVAIAQERLLVIGNIFILKFNESDISSEYIKCFLDSEKGQNELRRFSAGATTPVLHIQNINKILIPVHEQNVQKQMNKKAEKIVEELINAYESIDRNKKIINLMYK